MNTIDSMTRTYNNMTNVYDGMPNIYGNITNNLAAVFPARWYPTEGDREHYLDVNVELVGTIDRRTGYPIQNLRASTKGTVVRVGQSFPVKERQEVAFLGLWWLVVACGRGAI